MVDHRLKFETYCLSVWKKKNSKILTDEAFGEIVDVLNGSIAPNPNMRKRITMKKYSLVDFPNLGLKKYSVFQRKRWVIKVSSPVICGNVAHV